MESNKDRQQRFRERAKALAGNEVLATVEKMLTDAMDEAYVLTRGDGEDSGWRDRHNYVLDFANTPAAALRQHFEDCLPLAHTAGQRDALLRACQLIELVAELRGTGVT